MKDFSICHIYLVAPVVSYVFSSMELLSAEIVSLVYIYLPQAEWDTS